jgi:hypothetical protein
MKYITLIIGLLVVGCGETYPPPMPPEKTDTNESTPTTNTNKVDGTTEKPVKELTAEEKVVGTYEAKVDKRTFKGVFLENGKAESYKNGEKDGEGTWKIVGNEVHVSGDEKPTTVFKIKPNGDLTFIAVYNLYLNETGKREGVLKRDQSTFKKIK